MQRKLKDILDEINKCQSYPLIPENHMMTLADIRKSICMRERIIELYKELKNR